MSSRVNAGMPKVKTIYTIQLNGVFLHVFIALGFKPASREYAITKAQNIHYS
jgi:hypothetical protein